MIWSVIPEELIFASYSRADRGEIVDYQGHRVCLRQGRIDRLISSDPRDYLDRRFQPGSAIIDIGIRSDY